MANQEIKVSNTSNPQTSNNDTKTNAQDDALTTPSSTSMISHALSYAQRGWAVFPCSPKAKTPATSNGFKSATTDEERIKKWWSDHPNCNIAIATGHVSGGLLIIDVDVHDPNIDAIQNIRDWESQYGQPLPNTLMALTGSGGVHIFYHTDKEVKNSVNRDMGVDVRGDGGYIVAPPSIHPCGGEYKWHTTLEVAEANETVFAFLNFLKGGKPIGSHTAPVVKAPEENFVLGSIINQGGRNDQLYKYVCSMQAKGMGDVMMWNELVAVNESRVKPPLSESELKKLYNSALRHEKGTHRVESMPYTLDRKITPKGVILDEVVPTLTNLVAILNNDPRLRDCFFWDERAFTKMVQGVLPASWKDDLTGTRQFMDNDVVEFRYFLENLTNPEDPTQRMPVYATTNMCKDALDKVCMNNKRNLVAEYLDSLEWDGQERMARSIIDFLGADDCPEIEAFTRVFLFGAVARAYQPGTKFDYMPVLVGKQGIGKSYFLRMLASRNEWFLDNLATMEGDDAIEKLRGMWIVEIAELASIKRDRIETIKAFITQTNDIFRPKYGRETVMRPRGCVFCGTTNSYAFLSDPTGNRRFLPIEVGRHEPRLSLFEDSEGVRLYFEQMWAEAVWRWKNEHPPLVLTSGAQEVAEGLRQNFSEDDPSIGIIEQYLQQKLNEYLHNTTDPNPRECAVCGYELAIEALGWNEPKKWQVSECHNIMRHKIEGWELAKSNVKFKKYGTQRAWIPIL